MQLGAEATMDTEKLFIHDGSQGQGAEGIHTRIIDPFRVFMRALKLEGEIVGQMATFVVAS
jgi:hypothetical protein